MRKLISIVMVLCLLLGAAIAESAPLMTYDFGDFTMDMPEDIQGSIVERAENVPFASLYENYDQTAPFNDNVNIVWNSAVEDLSILDPEQTATPPSLRPRWRPTPCPASRRATPCCWALR